MTQKDDLPPMTFCVISWTKLEEIIEKTFLIRVLWIKHIIAINSPRVSADVGFLFVYAEASIVNL